ncbi:hypothetical protein CIB84_015839 [Bambusicola thoracicus]|uniref:Uncharacterized protein n=1 Tax=Bambusicola thoracicus TaxID=9083 RepID=A0A2P4S8I7_BAMTH|nr:hypothetical protein CIB84_015839 [Bambusicola thoracicus]
MAQNLPHLAVVSLIISTAVFAYLKPPSISTPSLYLVVVVLYSVVPPAVKPLIDSMRNQELKGALQNVILQMFLNRDKFILSLSKRFCAYSLADLILISSSLLQSLSLLPLTFITLLEKCLRSSCFY